MKRSYLVFTLLWFLFSIPSANGHEIRPAYLQIIQVSENSYEVFWKVPSMGDAVPKIQPVFPSSFSIENLKTPNQIPGSVIYYYLIRSEESLQGKELYIKGLDKTLIDVLVTVTYLNGEKATLLLQADKDSSLIPGQTSAMGVVKTYTILGIEHILLGIDHLLFVLALIMITKGKWKILKTITAFTIAHSITLSLAALGYVDFPGAPVEAVIALSIVFLALEILKNINGEQTLTSKKPWIVAFSFGLLHGFGFAGALSDIGLPQQEIPLALAFFNVGVELGQLIFVVFVLGLIKLLSLYKNWPVYSKKIPAYAIGSLAAFWMIQRVVAFWE
ncbi:HupE/UreJ family protein [Lutimonas zeaxanthinifaciens]|uniref:HupE/UreJ family protein n=1 Tax=Lutimonas zeaxanthinifaciens TaxID=3060215 RepID=UPI00265CC50E|nr:HupE/UreJ family protein [Lutimonas sp. YSD2104]WKK67427.1 HupE/UreJ family protein [Lutimonas sp. YSD2104]